MLRPTACRKTCGVSHQLDGLADGRAAGLRRPHVGDQRLDLVPGLLRGSHDRVQILLAHVDEGDTGALGGQAERAGSAEAAGAEDQGRPLAEREPVLHGPTLRVKVLVL